MTKEEKNALIFQLFQSEDGRRALEDALLRPIREAETPEKRRQIVAELTKALQETTDNFRRLGLNMGEACQPQAIK